MKRLVKWSGIVCYLFVFGFMALGSGSSSSSSRESVTVKAEDDTPDDGDSADTADENADTADSGEASAADSDDAGEKEISYEISDTSFEYYQNSIGRTEYYGYVEILNTGNSDIYMDNCTFDLEDDDGHLLQSDSLVSKCPDVIGPGEKGYFYNGIGANQVDESVSLDNGINLVPQMKLSSAKGKPHAYPVSDISVGESDYGGVKVTGRVENDTDSDIDYLYVNIIFYDANGKAIALTGTSITDVGAGNKGSFDTSTLFANDNLKLEDIAETKVIAEESYYQF